jgi:hypothetical protein
MHDKPSSRKKTYRVRSQPCRRTSSCTRTLFTQSRIRNGRAGKLRERGGARGEEVVRVALIAILASGDRHTVSMSAPRAARLHAHHNNPPFAIILPSAGRLSKYIFGHEH